MSVPHRSDFESAYTGKAPWDIGKAQAAFVAVQDQIIGRLLDSGCGTGENALFFAEKGRDVTGIDYLEEPIARAIKKAESRGLTARFLVCNALEMPSDLGTYDSVIDSGLFHVFDDADRAKYVAALAAVTKPGGRLFLLCFSEEEPLGQGPRRVTQNEIRDSFSNGWEVESITASRFEVHPDRTDLQFSPGGPKAWFAVVRRTSDSLMSSP